MSKNTSAIIRNETILLNSDFNSIKEKIETDTIFRDLAAISTFNPVSKSITFKTEKIHPAKLNKNKTPVLLLFSNPHPLSVKSGMFLSEPHSRSFWQRLLACESMNPSEKLLKSINNWNDNTIGHLAKILLNQECSDKISLYFDCLEALPTNQYKDLKKLFPKKTGRELRKRCLQIPGMDNLLRVPLKIGYKGLPINGSSWYSGDDTVLL